MPPSSMRKVIIFYIPFRGGVYISSIGLFSTVVNIGLTLFVRRDIIVKKLRM